MEIDITKFFTTCAPMDYSASIAEIGDSAARYTWCAAKDDAPANSDLLDNDDKRQEFRDYVKSFGAWDVEEISSWNNEELTALFMQFISGDMREGDMNAEMSDDEWTEYQERAENGNISGRIYKGDNGKIYYYIGN